MRAFFLLFTADGGRPPNNQPARQQAQARHDRCGAGALESAPGRGLHGLKFKRQWTLGPCIVDFCCWEARLIVEVDGGQHSAGSDAARTAWLEAQGYRVIRFWNHEVLGNLEGVLQSILMEAERQPHPIPLPQAREGVAREETA